MGITKGGYKLYFFKAYCADILNNQALLISCFAMFNRASINMTQSRFCFLCILNERTENEATVFFHVCFPYYAWTDMNIYYALVGIAVLKYNALHKNFFIHKASVLLCFFGIYKLICCNLVYSFEIVSL